MSVWIYSGSSSSAPASKRSMEETRKGLTEREEEDMKRQESRERGAQESRGNKKAGEGQEKRT